MPEMFKLFAKNEAQHDFRSWAGDLIVGAASPSQSESKVGNDPFFKVHDSEVSPLQLRIQNCGDVDGKPSFELTNLGQSIALSSGPRIHRGRKIEFTAPISFRIGNTHFNIVQPEQFAVIDDAITSLCLIGDELAIEEGIQEEQSSPGPATLTAWFESLSGLQKAVAGSHELFELACRALFNPGGLDGGFVLLPSTSGWQIAASHIPYPDHGISFREEMVDQAVSLRKTLFHDAKIIDHRSGLSDLHSAVVCPVFGADDKVYGVLYGFRSLHRRNSRRGIRRLEAQFVQVVADSISSGIFRLDSEAEAARSKVLLEQVFAPDVAARLQHSPEILEGQEKEVSVLFADMRGFSTLSERIGPQLTYELLSDMMDRFSSIIATYDGVIIDFYGDGVSAFWNAPIEVPEHAMFACQAAFDMLDSLDEMNSHWAAKLGQPISVGIGINTGISLVGNSGSSNRLKYGPRGSVVNLASRLENATKNLGIPLLISKSTFSAVCSSLPTRHVDAIELKGFAEPNDVYQVFPNKKSAPTELCQRDYAASLELIAASKIKEAAEILHRLSETYPDDQAVKYLASKTAGGESVRRKATPTAKKIEA